MIRLLLVGLLLFHPKADISRVRTLFLAAAQSEDKVNELLKITENAPKDDVVLRGYHGVAKTLLAKYTINPMNKISYFNKGKKILEAAIAVAPDNVELRYLRLTLQENVPGILGYSDMIGKDRAFLKEKLPGITDKQLSKMISDYLALKK
jgi:SpoVK/Ycf46/Vps4 family AAA+-type ATPase